MNFIYICISLPCFCAHGHKVNNSIIRWFSIFTVVQVCQVQSGCLLQAELQCGAQVILSLTYMPEEKHASRGQLVFWMSWLFSVCWGRDWGTPLKIYTYSPIKHICIMVHFGMTTCNNSIDKKYLFYT